MYLLAEIIPAVRRLRLPINRDQVILLLAAFNELMLGIETTMAHLLSGTIRSGEWVPIIFGPVAGVLLGIAGLIALRKRQMANSIASLVFLASMVVGVLGSYFHLHRAILSDAPAGQQLNELVLLYAPPLLSPLTFILIGILGISAAWEELPLDSGLVRLIGRRQIQMPLSKTRAYFLMTALFILVTVVSSVIDHARSGFANPWLWLPTIIGIFTTLVTLSAGAFKRLQRSDLITYAAAMILMALVGLLGAWFHVDFNRTGQGAFIVERFLRGAPAMAPLLFADMGLLGLVVLLDPAPVERKKKEPPLDMAA